MVYYILKYLEGIASFPGSGLYKYISFRSTCAAIISLLISILLSKKLILFFTANNIKEKQRDLGITDNNRKDKVPTMGGLSILLAIIVPTILFAKLHNIYVLLLLFSTIGFGIIGFTDDYIKVFKNNKTGLSAKKKLIGQVIIASTIALTLHFHKDVLTREVIYANTNNHQSSETISENDIKSTKTNIPFFKNNILDYSKLIPFLHGKFTWIVYLLVIVFIICAMSNAANITDGLDGLVAGSSAIMGSILIILSYLSGNLIFAKYLDLIYIPNLGETTIFCTAFVGACIGFMWYNAYPAQIFMGDTGSLALGGIIAVIAIIIRNELLLPLLCGVFVLENLSVILQVSYFKYTKHKYGFGKRIFLCSPVHHHFQKKGVHESKIVSRFFIANMIFAILTLMTLKIR